MLYRNIDGYWVLRNCFQNYHLQICPFLCSWAFNGCSCQRILTGVRPSFIANFSMYNKYDNECSCREILRSVNLSFLLIARCTNKYDLHITYGHPLWCEVRSLVDVCLIPRSKQTSASALYWAKGEVISIVTSINKILYHHAEYSGGKLRLQHRLFTVNIISLIDAVSHCGK